MDNISEQANGLRDIHTTVFVVESCTKSVAASVDSDSDWVSDQQPITAVVVFALFVVTLPVFFFCFFLNFVVLQNKGCTTSMESISKPSPAPACVWLLW